MNAYVQGAQVLASRGISPSAFSALAGEIEFWSRQLSEHALFMSMGLEDPALKSYAESMHVEWELFRQGASGRDLLVLCAELRGLKTEVFDRLTRGEWLGWLFPTFIDHTRRELDLFVRHVETVHLDEGELREWLQFMAEHAAFAAHLLDPVEAEKVKQATAVAGDFASLCAKCGSAVTEQMLVLSQKKGEALDAWLGSSGLGTAETKSIVHPVLAAHVVREGRRFLDTVHAMRGA